MRSPEVRHTRGKHARSFDVLISDVLRIEGVDQVGEVVERDARNRRCTGRRVVVRGLAEKSITGRAEDEIVFFLRNFDRCEVDQSLYQSGLCGLKKFHREWLRQHADLLRVEHEL